MIITALFACSILAVSILAWLKQPGEDRNGENGAGEQSGDDHGFGPCNCG